MSDADKVQTLAELLNNPEALAKARNEQQAIYMQEYRKKKPEAAEANRATIRAQAKALRRLAAEHPDRYYEIYTEERAKEGLGPPRRKKLTSRHQE